MSRVRKYGGKKYGKTTNRTSHTSMVHPMFCKTIASKNKITHGEKKKRTNGTRPMEDSILTLMLGEIDSGGEGDNRG